MPKRVSMKGRGLEAVYGAYEAAPIHRSASVDAYDPPGSPAQQPDDEVLLKQPFILIVTRLTSWRACGSPIVGGDAEGVARAL